MPVSFALKIQIRSDVKIREHADQSMERVGFLKRGSIVEIPDEFTVLKNGKPNLELTLNNWLRNAGRVRPTSKVTRENSASTAGLYSFDGENRDYFFPVRITNPADGSTMAKGHQNNQHYIALKFLARQGSALIVSDDVTLTKANEVRPGPRKEAVKPRVQPKIEIQAAAPAESSVDPQTEMEATTPCATGPCVKPTDTSAPVHKLVAAISPALAKIDQKTKQVAAFSRQNVDEVRDNFRKSCGVSLESFLPVIKQRAEASGIPMHFLLGLMTQESKGRCFILNSESDETQSIGLFQINSDSSKFKRCTSAQKETLRASGSVDRLANGPRCLENPLVNLDESIRILQDKKQILSQGNGEVAGFDFSRLSEDDVWRLTASAYNGGQRWVFSAKKDLETFNQKNGTSLSASNWEDLRLFYMRSWLNRDERAQMLGSTNEGRSRKNAITNLAYVEAVVGRDPALSRSYGLSRTWLAALQE